MTNYLNTAASLKADRQFPAKLNGEDKLFTMGEGEDRRGYFCYYGYDRNSVALVANFSEDNSTVEYRDFDEYNVPNDATIKRFFAKTQGFTISGKNKPSMMSAKTARKRAKQAAMNR